MMNFKAINTMSKEAITKEFNMITMQMNRLEEVIAREQKYIMKWGEKNDKNSDTQWEEYKSDAERNLKIWNCFKIRRDELKRFSLTPAHQVSC